MAFTHPSVKVLIVAGTFVTDPMAPIAYSQLARGLDAEIMTLSRAGLDRTDASVRKVIRRLETYEEPPVLVGHSQGGLVSVLAAQQRPDLAAGVISLGAPLQGTLLAPRWLPIPGLASMAVGSDVVRDVAPAGHDGPRYVSIVGEKDAVILPQWSGLQRCAEQFSFPVGHLNLILDREVLGFVRFLIEETDWVESPTEDAIVA